MRTTVLLCISFCISICANTQNSHENAESIINDIFEQYNAESNTTLDYESFYNDLIGLIEKPLDLNTATSENLQQLAFLNTIQIENILAYRYKQVKFNSLYELQLIDGLDMTDIARMLAFITVSDNTENTKKVYLRDFFKHGRSELYYRFDIMPEQKSGYIDNNENYRFAGSPVYNSLKYKYQLHNRFFAGITMEKDAGEQFWGKLNKGYDFYSFHLQATKSGIFKNIIVGNYRASFGQGLIINSSFGGSKSSYVTNIMNMTNGFQKSGSTNEQDFLRGVCTTIQLGKAELSAFYSSKKMDADTAGGTFPRFRTTGLHRSLSEINKKHSISMQTTGFNIALKLDYVRVGITAVGTQLSHSIQPEQKPYNLLAFRGNKQSGISVDYRWRLGIFQLFGEIATTNNFELATVHGVQFAPISTVQLVALYRNYSPEYDTFYAGAFSENSETTNEKGLYLGASINPFRKWKFSVYADSYRFPWLKYGVDAPSIGRDYLMQADYTYSRNLNMKWRVKYEEKMKNALQGAINTIYPYAKMSLRYQINYSVSIFSYKSQLELSMSDSTTYKTKWGFVASQDIGYEFAKIPLSINFRCMYFDAKDYNNRFYLYENDVLYAFAIPMFYGTGFRYYLNLKYELSKRMSCWLKVSQTAYDPDIKSISSGVDEIAGNKRSDIRFLLRYKF